MIRHQLRRPPEATWLELRVSVDSVDCYRPHSHREYSVGIVDEGEAVFRHPGGPDRIGAGTVVLIEPGVLHACNPLPGRRWSYRMLYLDADWFHEAMAPVLPKTDTPMELKFASRAIQHHACTSQIDRLCRCIEDLGDLQRLPCQLSRLLAPLLLQTPRPDPGALHDELRPAFELLDVEPAAYPQVRDLARACGMTASLFVRRFKSAHGITPGQYLENERLNGARRLLAQGMPLAQVAQAMGYADQPHLQRAFKSRYAMTPGTYAGA